MRTVLVMLLAAAVSSWALEVKLPTRPVPAKGVWVVDEVGAQLFGTTPARVEVTNLPASQVAGQPVSFRSTAVVPGPNVDPSVVVATVPVDHAFLMTDIEGIYFCCGGGSAGALTDGTGVRLAWVSANPPGQRSYTTGILFNPGETISLGVPTGEQCSGAHGGDITLMGRLLPVS